ncbi:MAG: YceI family protein [bacterium]
MNKSRMSVIAVLALALPVVAGAETHHFMVDSSHSEVGFKARHLVSTVPGRFNDFEGEIWMDPADIAGTLKMSAVVQAASINTDNEKRDGHLQSPDFFNVAEFPEITFQSTSVKKDGDEYVVTGNLTMHGVTKSVTLTAEYGGVATNPFTSTPTIGLDLSGKVNRQDFGISWNKTLDAGGVVVGDEVKLDIHLEATVPPAKS